MPSNTSSKASASKKENKQTAPKNPPQALSTKDTNPRTIKSNPMRPSDPPDPEKLATKASQGTASGTPMLPIMNSVQDTADEASNGVGVNRKKQKRRQKEAAKKAAEHGSGNGPPLDPELVGVPGNAYRDIVQEVQAAHSGRQSNGYNFDEPEFQDANQYEPEEEALYYDEDPNQSYQDAYSSQTNGHSVHDYIPQDVLTGKSKRKKRNVANSFSHDAYSGENPSLAVQRSYHAPPPPPPPPHSQHAPSSVHRSPHNDPKDRIWNTSTTEERERIKEFWLSLGEEERRSLVKVEKEAVLKKMKEQQKHSCSCTVCGRKRTAIEEELEVLYDAYYEELEVYADPNQASHDHGIPPRSYAHSMARMPPNQHPRMQNRQVSRRRIQELRDDEEPGEEDYSEDEDDEEISEDEFAEQAMRPIANGTSDFFNFGKSLTVQGGILTVADDLLKNDGKKFIEMMEQLAERRMQREEEQYARAGVGHQALPNHNHGPPPEEEAYDDEEDEEEYEEDDEEFDEEDEMESMTETERMEEGRRMFQIFAARMFEQRVLTAYREKVALERQQKLLEELDDESHVNAQKEAKKAKEAQKKKEKKRQQKEAKDAEKAKREAEKAAEEAAIKALEERKAEEVRQRKEEQRRKREAEKKAQEEERQRKEAEKQRRIQEAKDQQAEAERKQREQKDREKKKREDVKKREREEREEREAIERETKEKKERDLTEKKERESKMKAEHEARERVKQDLQLASKKHSPSHAPPPLLPPGLHPPLTTSSHTSPRLQIATPVVPKAPTPVRLRQASLQEPRSNSPKMSRPTSSSTTTSPSVSSGAHNGLRPTSEKSNTQGTPLSSSQAPNQVSPGAPPGQVTHPPGFPNMPPVSGNTQPAAFGPPLSPTTSQFPHSHLSQPPMGSGPHRNFMAPNGMPYPPGFGGPSHMPLGRGNTMAPPLPQISTGIPPGANGNDIARYGMSRDNIPSQTHSRNTSASFDRSALDTQSTSAQTQPIARPAPIKRPSSVAPHQQGEEPRSRHAVVDDLSNHLGSSALIDDDDTLNSQQDEPRHVNMPPGLTRNNVQGFGANPAFPNPIGMPMHHTFPRNIQAVNGNNWSSQQSPFGAPPMSGPPSWSNPPGFGRANNGNGFGTIGSPGRPSGSRAVTIRLLLRTACEKLRARTPVNQPYAWHHADDLLHEIQAMKPGHEAPIHMAEMLDICDTEGNNQNGGGSFAKVVDDPMGPLVRFDPGRNTSFSGRGAGDIGSPIIGGGGIPAIGGQRAFQQPGGF